LDLFLHNTLTRKKERFASLEAGRVKMFTCGPSIYSRSHIGNFRTFLFEDILQRYLEYLGCRVERVINFTDVEDKTMAAAFRQGQTLAGLTEPVAERFRQEAELLGIKLPEEIPRSSTSIDEAVQLIKILLAKGYAYRHGRDIFFEPVKFPGFGKLYGLDMRRWPRKKRRFHKDTYPGQRWNLGDFILWHGHRPGIDETFSWETEIGRGRPSWNIQDPAIIRKHLGEQIDISCGGVDNLFRHHDYNLAIMEAATGRQFASFWLHAAHVLVAGIKMSKSRGNIIYPQDLLKRHELSPWHLRFFLIHGHYRQQLDLKEGQLAAAREKLDLLQATIARLRSSPVGASGEAVKATIRRLPAVFEERMNDDLDVSGAMDTVAEVLSGLAVSWKEKGLGPDENELLRQQLLRIDGVLGILLPPGEGKASSAGTNKSYGKAPRGKEKVFS
jgi:cysteinyl-tRNA synthetase